jgi:hypothetical protein
VTTASTAHRTTAVGGSSQRRPVPVVTGVETRAGTVCAAEAAALAPGFEADSEQRQFLEERVQQVGWREAARVARRGGRIREQGVARAPPASTSSRSSAMSAAVA